MSKKKLSASWGIHFTSERALVPVLYCRQPSGRAAAAATGSRFELPFGLDGPGAGLFFLLPPNRLPMALGIGRAGLGNVPQWLALHDSDFGGGAGVEHGHRIAPGAGPTEPRTGVELLWQGLCGNRARYAAAGANHDSVLCGGAGPARTGPLPRGGGRGNPLPFQRGLHCGDHPGRH